MPTVSLRIFATLLNLFSIVVMKSDRTIFPAFSVTTKDSNEGITSVTQNTSSKTSRIQPFTKTCGKTYTEMS